MKNQIIISSIFLLLFQFIPHFSYACSVFCIQDKDSPIIGRNYDWYFGEGMVIINKRNQTKTALIELGENKKNLAHWTSKYGSVTFVQYGREIAFSGINETGLSVQELELVNTQYPAPDSRATVSFDQYVQFILDNYSSIDEIIESDKFIRVRSFPNCSKIHFFIVDNSGKSLIIEFLNGKTVFHYGETIPIKVLANDTYDNNINYLNSLIKNDYNYASSLNRFARAASMVTKYKSVTSIDPIKYAFNILDSVRQDSTKFQIVFDIKKHMIYFKSYRNIKLRYFSFDNFDYTTKSVSKVLDLNSELEGNVSSEFIDYTTQINEALIKKSWIVSGSNFDWPNSIIQKAALKMISHYPETFICN